MNNEIKIDKRALVTGATGYIGSNLVRHLLSEGWDVHIINRPHSNLSFLKPVMSLIKVHSYDGTTSNMVNVVANSRPNVVFHLASLFVAEHNIEQIEPLISSNILFSTQLVEAMAINEVKYIVNTGTSWQHYNNENYNPVNLYAATKQAFEDILAYYIETYNLKVTTLKLFDTYGPNDSRSKLIPLLWKTALTQQPLSMSPGEQLIELVYIDDVTNAYVMAAEALKYQDAPHTLYDVISGAPIKLVDLVNLFQKITKKKLPISFGERPYRAREVMHPSSQHCSLPRWTAKVPLEIGIKKTMPLIINSAI